MGSDKAFLAVDGTGLLERVVAAAEAAGASAVQVIGGNAKRIQALGYEYVADIYPRMGPLGATITALVSASQPAVLVLPCDLLEPKPAVLAEIVAALSHHDVVVPTVGGRSQWATATWSVAALPALMASFDRGVRALRHAVGSLSVVQPTILDQNALADVDTPADFRRWSEVAGFENLACNTQKVASTSGAKNGAALPENH